MPYPNQTLEFTHPEFARRLLALRDAVRTTGGDMGWTSTSRSYATQLLMYQAWRTHQRSAAAASPYAVGPVSPWGWRSRGSFHMVQEDEWSHGADLWREGIEWSRLHMIGAQFGVIFPLVHMKASPEPWHAQWWNSPVIAPAPALDTYSGITPVPTPPSPTAIGHTQEGDMHEFQPTPRPTQPATLDFTWLPAEGRAYGVTVFSRLFVRRSVANGHPEHVRIYMGGRPADATWDPPASDDGLYWLPDDGQPIEIPCRGGFTSVEGQGAAPIAVAQYVSFFTG